MKILLSFNEKIDLNNDAGYQYKEDNIWIDKKPYLYKNENDKIWLLGNLYNLEGEDIALSVYNILKKESWEGIKKIDGEFTLIAYLDNQWFVYRDRHGAGSQIYFTGSYCVSHPQLLHQFKNVQITPDFDTIALFLRIGYIPSPQTALKNVSKLPGGYLLTYKNNIITLKDLYSYDEFGKSSEAIKITEQEATEEYEHLHKKAILSRVKNSKKVQLLLSGGYDSGGNIAGLRDVYQGDAVSYSIGFKDNPWSELPLAKLMSEVYNTKHFEYEIDGTEIEDLPQIVAEFGDPFNENGMMVNYAVMKLVKEHNGEGVILGGDGNDQHFGSAGRELALHYKYKKNGLAVLQNIFQLFADMPIFNKDNIFFKLRFHNEKILKILESDAFGFRTFEISKMLKERPSMNKPQYLEKLPQNISSFDELFNVHNYFGDIKQVINEVILFKASKLASQMDNHLTFPYMSTDLYNFLKTLPRSLKLKGDINACAKGNGKSKYLHKNYLYSKLPKEITERKKQGGFAPLPIFFKDEERFQKISKIILKSEITKKYLNQSYVEHILNEYRTQNTQTVYWFWNQQVRAFKIFNLLVLVIWWETIIRNQKIEKLSDLL